MSDDKAAAISTWLDANATWVDKSFKTVIVPTELVRLDLDKNTDTKAFLEYRTELITSISIALNIPVDLIMPKSSNRSTSEVAFEMLNQNIVKPMQTDFVKTLREQLRPDFGDVVDTIEMNPSDVYDEKKDMEIHTGYIKGRALTPNEVRAKLGYPAVEWGDTLSQESGGQNPADTVTKEIQEIRKSLSAIYE